MHIAASKGLCRVQCAEHSSSTLCAQQRASQASTQNPLASRVTALRKGKAQPELKSEGRVYPKTDSSYLAKLTLSEMPEL